MQNKNRDTPLHYAAAYAISPKAVKALIDAAPSSILQLNASRQSPIDRAKANNSPSEIIQMLERSGLKYSQKVDGSGWPDEEKKKDGSSFRS